MSVDWGIMRFGRPVRCRIVMRPEYHGRKVKERCAALDGEVIDLQPLWLMDRDDPYPDEWALTTPGSCEELFRRAGISWIASGDVVPIPTGEDANREPVIPQPRRETRKVL